MAFVRQYWFGFLSSLILACGFFLFMLVLLSPRQDIRKRGFIPCTEAMAEGILSCPKDGYYTCLFGHILRNSWCDAKVIGRGVSLWVEGKQKTPWANYIFEPELQVDEYPDDEILQEFYDNNPDMEFDLHKLNNLSRELDEKLKKEESKNDGK